MEIKDKENLLILRTDASISRSILTAWPPEEIKDNSPVSVLSIAKMYNLPYLMVVDSSFLNFINLYKESQKIGIQLIFGVEFNVVEDANDLSPESLLTESKIQVYMKNSAGYKDLIKLYSKANSDRDRFYYNGRLSYSEISEINSDNLMVCVPFYDSFLANNLLKYKSRCIPNFGKIRPIFALENHDLPFDDLIRDTVLEYTKNNGYDTVNSHTALYYKRSDIDSYVVFRSINKRSSFAKPNLSHMSSCHFSVEDWLNNQNIKL
jgi:DNA polymerase III alpha subunit